MKKYFKSALNKKAAVSEVCYNLLFEALSFVPMHVDRFQAHIKGKLTGYYSVGSPHLLRAGEISDKAWFITDGAVVAYFKGHLDREIANLFFNKGEFVVLPEAFMSEKESSSSLMACPDTHLLQITATDLKETFALFPEAEQLYRMIIGKQALKYRERDMLLSYMGIDRVRNLFKQYPDFKGPNPKIVFTNRIIASYLQLADTSFSRILRQIREEDKEVLR